MLLLDGYPHYLMFTTNTGRWTAVGTSRTAIVSDTTTPSNKHQSLVQDKHPGRCGAERLHAAQVGRILLILLQAQNRSKGIVGITSFSCSAALFGIPRVI